MTGRRPTQAEMDAERVRRARQRAAVVASIPSHVEDARPVRLPVQRHGPRPGARPAADLLRGPAHPATAPMPLPGAYPRAQLAGRIALVVAALFVLVVYLLPVLAATGWW